MTNWNEVGPRMAQVLLDRMKTPNKDGDCVFCSAWIEENKYRDSPPNQHRDDCAALLVLREAGVTP